MSLAATTVPFPMALIERGPPVQRRKTGTPCAGRVQGPATPRRRVLATVAGVDTATASVTPPRAVERREPLSYLRVWAAPHAVAWPSVLAGIGRREGTTGRAQKAARS